MQLLVLILFYAPYGFSENKMTMNYLLLVQYLPRMYRIFLSTHKFRINSSVWFKGAFYFFMYIFASHVSFIYVLQILFIYIENFSMLLTD